MKGPEQGTRGARACRECDGGGRRESLMWTESCLSSIPHKHIRRGKHTFFMDFGFYGKNSCSRSCECVCAWIFSFVALMAFSQVFFVYVFLSKNLILLCSTQTHGVEIAFNSLSVSVTVFCVFSRINAHTFWPSVCIISRRGAWPTNCYRSRRKGIAKLFIMIQLQNRVEMAEKNGSSNNRIRKISAKNIPHSRRDGEREGGRCGRERVLKMSSFSVKIIDILDSDSEYPMRRKISSRTEGKNGEDWTFFLWKTYR